MKTKNAQAIEAAWDACTALTEAQSSTANLMDVLAEHCNIVETTLELFRRLHLKLSELPAVETNDGSLKYAEELVENMCIARAATLKIAQLAVSANTLLAVVDNEI